MPGLGGDPVMRDKVESNPAVRIYNDTAVSAIVGGQMVAGIKVKTDGREELIPVEGIFVEIGLIPNSKFAKSVDKNERGEIKINSNNETNVPGVFAAGDVTDVPEKQIVIAAGEGSKAALGAFKYISRTR